MFRLETVVFLSLLLGWSVLTKAPPLFVLSLILLLAIGISQLWERYCLVGVEYRRTFPSNRVDFGEEIVLEIETVNRKLLPLSWMEFEDEIPSALRPTLGRIYRSQKKDRSILSGLVALRPYERIRRHYPIRCGVRGEHVFGPVTLRSGDLFGFADCEKVVPMEETLIVYPRVLPLTQLGLPARSPLGELRAQSWVFEDLSRTAGAREYLPGDELRRVHWPASARLQALQTRVYEATTSHRLGIFLNVSAGDRQVSESDPETAGDPDPDILELSIMAAASIASWGLEQGYQTGIYTNGQHRGSTGCVVVEPASDSVQLERLLIALARLQPPAVQPFDLFLSERLRQLPFGTTVVVVTGALDHATTALLLDLRSRGHPATVALTGRASPPDRLPGITIRWIGPAESWRDLATIALAGDNGLER